MHIWWKIFHSLQETIQTKCEFDGGMDLGDLSICKHLKLHFQNEFSGVAGHWYHKVPNHPRRQGKRWVNHVDHWSPPPLRVLKVNIDGSS